MSAIAGNDADPTTGVVEAERGAQADGRGAADYSAAALGTQPSSACKLALAYAARGWHVFPVGPNKCPLTAHGHTDASTDAATIREWWRRWQNAEIGVACGASGLVVVDLDLHPAQSKDGIAEFAEHLGTDPHGCQLIASTPRGGRHYYYADPHRQYGIAAAVAGSRAIDVRGDGGYVVAPSGRPDRQWVEGDLDGDLTEPPVIVTQLLPPRRNRPAGDRGRGRMAPAGTCTDDRLAEVQSALAALDPSMKRPSWLQVLFAVHAALDADERGAELVEQWSAGTTVAGQYLAGEAWGTYSGAVLPWHAKPDRPMIDAETLFALAYDAGWSAGRSTEAADLSPAFCQAPPAATAPSGDTEQRAQSEPVEGFGPVAFPEDLIAGDDAIARAARAICSSAPIPQPALALGAVMVALGALLGRRVQTAGSPLRTNLYCLGIGGTSSGKNHPLTAAAHHLARVNPSLLGPREFKSDSGIYASLQTTICFASFVDEFGLFLRGATDKNAQPHARGIATALLTLFTSSARTIPGAAYANQVLNKPVPIHEPCVSIYGLTTPSTLIEALSSKNVADGLLGRCLHFQADERAKKRRGIFHPERQEMASDTVVTDLWKGLLNALSTNNELPDGNWEAGDRCRTVPFTGEAADYLDQLLDIEERKKGDGHLGAIWARFVEHVAKVSLIHAVANDPKLSAIGIEHVQWARQLVDWCVGNMERLLRANLSDSDVEAKTKRVLRIIVDAGASGLNSTALTRRTQWLTRSERKDIIATLVEGGDVGVEQIDPGRPDRKGKPTTIYRFGGAK